MARQRRAAGESVDPFEPVGTGETHEIAYRRLFEEIPIGIFRTAADGRILEANPAVLQMFGYNDAAELLKINAADLYADPDERRRWRERIERDGTLRDVELQFKKRDGTIFWASFSVRTVQGRDGRPLHYEGAAVDITGRKRTEQTLRDSQTRQALLSSISAGVTSGLSMEDIIRRTLLTIGRKFPTLRVAYSTIDGEGRMAVIQSFQPQGMPDLTGATADLTLAPEYLAALEAKRPVIVQDVDSDPRLAPLAAVVRQGGARAVLDVPVRHTERLAGLLCFDAPSPRRWSEHEIATLKDVGDYLAVAIKNALTESQRHDEEVRRQQSEQQFLQSQKMESVGRLAGGIAHDFNNLLTVINGHAEMVMAQLKEGDPLRNVLLEIQKAGDRAAGLTRQLLAFSRKQVLQPRILDLNQVITEMDKMLRRVIGEDVELVNALRPSLWPVKADPGQIEQVIMNLVINARDAMPQGGKIVIDTANVVLDESYASRHMPLKTGPYVMLALSDTGTGISREVQAHIFEPFFTTKEQGKGTGLGLSTVYGIVKQSGGCIWLYSEPGRGTTFKIYLPQAGEAIVAAPIGAERPLPKRGTETLLLVEDEDVVRFLTREILVGQGYTVLEASRGDEAIRICTQHGGPIHLMVTDVVMPGMSGPQVAKALQPLRPEMKVLYVSGYTDDAIVHHGILTSGLAFLQKPFAPESLARKVREVLERDGATTAG